MSSNWGLEKVLSTSNIASRGGGRWCAAKGAASSGEAEACLQMVACPQFETLSCRSSAGLDRAEERDVICKTQIDVCGSIAQTQELPELDILEAPPHFAPSARERCRHS